MNLTWKPQGDGVETAVVLDNPLGLVVAAEPFLSAWRWAVYVTTPMDLYAIEEHEAPSLDLAKHLATARAEVLMRDLRTRAERALAGPPIAELERIEAEADLCPVARTP